METVKQVRALVKAHKGRVMMDALVQDDTWTVQVMKVDVLHYLKFFNPTDVSPVYTRVDKHGDLHLHPMNNR